MELPSTTFFKKKLREKVKDAVWEDVQKYGRSDLKIAAAREAILDSSGRCENCDCQLNFGQWSRWCLNQFTLDRVDLSRPHAAGNLRLLCFYCNGRIGSTRDEDGLPRRYHYVKPACLSGCCPNDAPRVQRPTKVF